MLNNYVLFSFKNCYLNRRMSAGFQKHLYMIWCFLFPNNISNNISTGNNISSICSSTKF